MKVVIALDPGNTETAVVVLNKEDKKILTHAKLANESVLQELGNFKSLYGQENCELAIEMVASYGMPVGRSVFDTCVWIGRYIATWNGKFRLIVRKDVKMNICHSTKANDANIRQALMDRFGSTKELAVGTKSAPGPLYGIGNDERAALALAYTALETECFYTLGELKERAE
jgi:hypothetical protein